MDENALIREAQRGSLDAFNALVLTYQDSAYNLAYRLLSDGDEAADITQKAFISAYRNLTSFRGGSFRAWLLRMVTNACYDELRRRKRHPTIALEPLDQDEEEVESPFWLADEDPSPEQVMVNRELELALQHCLEDIPPEFRAVVVLVDVEGRDYQEVAGVIDKPLGTVKSRLARARLKLRDCLRYFLGTYPDAGAST